MSCEHGKHQWSDDLCAQCGDWGAGPESIQYAHADGYRQAMKAFIGILFEECQPGNGDLFSRVDDRIRAEMEKTNEHQE